MEEKLDHLAKKETQELAVEEKLLEKLFVRADYVVNKNYLMQLPQATAICACDEADIQNISANAKFFRIDRIVYDKNENNLEKLTSLYSAAHVLGANVALLLHSDGKSVELYLGVMDMGLRADPILKTLYDHIRGNFPGSLGGADKYNELCMTDTQMDANFNLWFSDDNDGIASVSGIPATRSEQPEENQKFVQGLEKVIDAMRGQSFTALILAQNVSDQALADIKAEYEMLYTNLSPYAKSVLTYGENESQGVSTSLAHSVSESMGTSESHTLSVGRSETKTHGVTEGTTDTDTLGVNAGVNAGVNVGVNAGLSIQPMGVGVNAGINAGANFGANFGANYSHSHGRSHSVSDSTSIGTTTTEGTATGTQKMNAETDTEQTGQNSTQGSSFSRQLEYHNKPVEDILQQVEEQLKRIRASACYGMFGAAAYFIAPDLPKAKAAASTYKSIITGQGSFVETAQICGWSRADCKKAGRPEQFQTIESSLRCFRHPVFELDTGEKVTPASLVSGRELAIEMGLPMRSVPGVAVVEKTPFGRNVNTAGRHGGTGADGVRLGRIYHMGETESGPVLLDKSALTAHTFITGSTGAGKSNVIYTLLNNLCRPDEDGNTTFLVIEPAKGEYKDVFGGYPSVSVYGTNGKKAPLLRLDPFSFPDDIHVLEHIDRLVEVFNACWPMYAAMPAVLKDAIEEAYIARGWSLSRSICAQGKKVYPTFGDVLRLLPEIMKRSEYSKDTQGDYTGALVTRVKSLTNGINGQIFCSGEELKDEDLFDKNVIVDLSRVGSSETKALLMGILMIKLQEHRMAEATGSNTTLRHVTVLEEAHNLLRRTSSEQSQDSANLQGKAVEMLTNAIAEMRTYGEGFIIADQAPGLLDMAVIRNTNTKLILRLPDESDRLLVGKAAGLTDEQIPELAKLDVGVAAVFQNHWLEPVLCQVDRFDDSRCKKFVHKPPKEGTEDTVNERLIKSLTDGADHIAALSKEDVDSLKNWLERLDVPPRTERELLRYAKGEALDRQMRKEILYSLADGKTILAESEQGVIDLKLGERLMISFSLAARVRGILCEYVEGTAVDLPELQERMRLLRDTGRKDHAV